MAEAIKEGKAHKDSFDAFHQGLSSHAPELVESWRVWVEEWEKNSMSRMRRIEYEEEGV
jgi:hypothetical protein